MKKLVFLFVLIFSINSNAQEKKATKNCGKNKKLNKQNAPSNNIDMNLCQFRSDDPKYCIPKCNTWFRRCWSTIKYIQSVHYYFLLILCPFSIVGQHMLYNQKVYLWL